MLSPTERSFVFGGLHALQNHYGLTVGELTKLVLDHRNPGQRLARSVIGHALTCGGSITQDIAPRIVATLEPEIGKKAGNLKLTARGEGADRVFKVVDAAEKRSAKSPSLD
jgi:hypothetical protein